MIEHAAAFGVVGQALRQGRVTVRAVTPRAFTTNVHQTIDDRPFGGGDGMIMLAETAALALESLQLGSEKKRVIHLSPRGVPLTDEKARALAAYEDLVLISSRYGGIDERFLESSVDEEISIGDYVLSGGELAALVVIDSVSRLLPGVLGNETSPEAESFGGPHGLLEYPQYTRPREWRGRMVPEALLTGDHAKIRDWKECVSVLITAERRPELLANVPGSLLARALKIHAPAGVKNLELAKERVQLALKEKK